VATVLKKRYYPRQLSWLSFNQRVLQEAQDSKTPLLERIRFLGIFSSNLDEFMQVQFSDLRLRLSSATGDQKKKLDELFAEVTSSIAKSLDQREACYQSILKQLKKKGVRVVDTDELTTAQKRWLRDQYFKRIQPLITPIILEGKTDLKGSIRNDRLYLAVVLSKADQQQYLLVEVPTHNVPRFIEVPGKKGEQCIILVEQVIDYCLQESLELFFDFDEIAAYTFGVNRDAEFDVGAGAQRGLIEDVARGVRRRRRGAFVSFIYDRSMPDHLLSFFMSRLEINHSNALVIPSGRLHKARGLIRFPSLDHPQLLHPKIQALDHPLLSGATNLFDVVGKRDVLLCYPYHKYRNLVEFFRQASFDPAVTELQMTVYRVTKDSPLLNALVHAAANGKRVRVCVELKARFDEQNNIDWAQRLTDAGVDVLYTLPSVKVHAKLFMVTRIEKGEEVRYAHIGTGNFHEGNARVYTDFSLLTANKEITREVADVFAMIADPFHRGRFAHLLVSPLTLRRQLNRKIRDEIESALKGDKAELMIKVNNLIDREFVSLLYDASKAGVKIRIICRGMCTLIPGVKGLSENIEIISIVDRFLEHPRVFLFHAGGERQVYIASADVMSRNMDRRIEVAAPILCQRVKRTILYMLDLQWRDNVKARYINEEQDNAYVPQGRRKINRSQLTIHEYLDGRS